MSITYRKHPAWQDVLEVKQPREVLQFPTMADVPWFFWADLDTFTNDVERVFKHNYRKAARLWRAGSAEPGIRHARNGWANGADMINNALEVAKDVLDAVPAPVTSYGPAGRRPHVARYVQGNPSNMVRRHEGEVKQLRLLINHSSSAGLGTMTINRGAAIVATVDRLERQNTQVSIDVCTASYDGDMASTWQPPTYITVKHAGQRLPIENLAFVLASDWMRDMLWMMRSAAGGCSAHPAQNRLFTHDPGLVEVPGLSMASGRWDTPKQAVESLQEILAGHAEKVAR